jgi:hypothetical protein
MAQRTNRTEKLDLQLTPAAKHALRLAAESSHRQAHLLEATLLAIAISLQ